MNLFVLDTDMLTLFQTGHPKVTVKVQQHPIAELAVAVLTVEEQLGGWFNKVRQAKGRDQLAKAYSYLAKSAESLAQFRILPFTVPAILRFEALVATRLGVRHMDLRIGAVVLENSATLVTRNRRDFSRVPGLTIEDWSV